MNTIMNYILILLLLLSTTLKGQIKIKRTSQGSSLIAQNLKDHKVIFNYNTDFDLITNIQISPSPNKDLVSIVEQKTPKNRAIPLMHRLSVLDEGGNIITQVDSIIEISWDPNHTRISAIKGVKRSEGFAIPVSLVIIDFNDDNCVTEIDLENYYPIQLRWVSNSLEDAIYFRSRDIKSQFGHVKYDLETQKFHPSDQISSNFSPDGKYYIVSEYEAIEFNQCPDSVSHSDTVSCFGIYNSKTREKIEGYSLKNLGKPFGWVFGEGHLFMFKNYTEPIKKEKNSEDGRIKGTVTAGYDSPENNIYDVEKKVLVQSFKAIVYGASMLDDWRGKTNVIIAEEPNIGNSQRTSDKSLRIITSPLVNNE